MKDRHSLSAILYMLHINQLALAAAVGALGLWVEQRGSVNVSEAVKSHLSILRTSSDSISDAIAKLTAES